jgi:hypothetical protein
MNASHSAAALQPSRRLHLERRRLVSDRGYETGWLELAFMGVRAGLVDDKVPKKFCLMG